MLKVICFFIALHCFNFCLSNDAYPEVVTSLGRVRGNWKTSSNGRKYAAFEGVPFAKPPVGDLRFEEPQPITSWIGTWEAKTLHTCPQFGPFILDEDKASEDCLYLNVYVPAEFLGESRKLDVIIVIHGGAFIMGNAHMTSSEFLMDRDIVLVTNNYRLGIFGFLSTEDGVIPGNNGLKDQSLALKWVKDNIASFGGNPDSITLTGLSAGAASVHFHYFSPLSKGLFHRGISHSGTATCSWAIKNNPLDDAKKLAVLVGCPDESTKELKKCLKQRPSNVLLEQIGHFYGYNTPLIIPFAPVIEKGSSKPFLEKDPFVLLKEGAVFDVPWITSHTADEGLMATASYWDNLEEIDNEWDEAFHYLLDCNETLPESRRKAVATEILDFYFGRGQRINKDNFQKFTKIFTDRLFAVPGEVAARMQAKVTESPVYYYIFNYREGVNKVVSMFTKSSEVTGVAHGDDAIYFHGLFKKEQYSEKDKRLMDVCHNILTSYASTGKPSFDGSNIWQPTGWSEFTYLNISGPDDIKLRKIDNLTPIAFWRKLGLLDSENLHKRDEL